MQQVADKMNFQDPVQKYAECHSWDMPWVTQMRPNIMKQK